MSKNMQGRGMTTSMLKFTFQLKKSKSVNFIPN